MLQLEQPISKLNLADEAIKQRENAWQAFIDQGFPNKKNERWRYTDLTSLYKKYDIAQVKLGLNTNLDETLSMINLSTDMHNIIFVDGQLAYIDKIDGVAIQDSLSLQPQIENDDALSNLNIASYLGGVTIQVRKNTRLTKPIIMTYLHTDNSQKMLVNYQHTLVIDEYVECMICENFIALGDSYSAANICSNIHLKEGAKCRYDALESKSVEQLLVTHKLNLSIGKNAYYETFQMAAYAALKRIEFSVDLYSEGAVFNAKGIYALAHNAKVDYHFNVKHNASNTQSDVAFRGVVGGKASATFNAKAYVDKDLHSVKALQNNRNIQLTNTAEINTKPELEIYSDDVVCSHGATIGQLDPQVLFYLQSRGINKGQATSLLIEGFVKELITLLDRDESTIESYLNSLEGHIKYLV
ncbi:Fe-S cluster assembly protein SufD [Cysteiniphilum halobium]|uniref:Fe-S cluster assembly protein SufD n=1 Tax=Cysteiniphilum halobium TaxID=2219059 RepID=UPI003F867C44